MAERETTHSLNIAVKFDAKRAAAVAAQLDIALPPQCAPGVAQNAEMLAAHWAALRAPRPGG